MKVKVARRVGAPGSAWQYFGGLNFWRALLLQFGRENYGFLGRRSSLRIIDSLSTGLLGHNYVLFPMVLPIRNNTRLRWGVAAITESTSGHADTGIITLTQRAHISIQTSGTGFHAWYFQR
jgi:hypothetical protein